MEDLFSPSGWKAAALAAALLGWCGTARAEVLLFSANPGEQLFSITGLFDFNGPAAGGTTQTFTTSAANQRVILVFDATCFISGTGGAVVSILVNPAGSAPEAAAPPTNGIANGGALVRFQEAVSDDAGRVTVVAGVRPAVAGSHTVKVRIVPRGDFIGGPPPLVVMQAASLTVMR